VKKIFALLLVISLSTFSSCQKQQTDAERQAEIDRQVQQRLDAEHQAQEKEKLAQRESELDAREKALAEKQNAVGENSQPESRPTRTERATRTDERRPTASYDTFYTQLDRYGDWRETSDYGYVWQPRQAQSRTWRPYTNGHWVYTDVGWTWVSEEPFGWATYHYGRWTRLRNIGWIWVPGDEWAPAWVSWRKSNDYVGWAPLPPEARFDRGTGIHNWSDSYYDVGPDQYCFVETRQFGAPRLENAVVPSERNVTIVNQTTNVTNITYNNTTIVNQGPSYDEIRTQTQQPIERLRLEREVNINVNVGEPRPVVRGQAIVIPAPLIARGQAIERPRRVKETITNVVVDRGWENTGDRQTTEKVRVKMKAEATPPPNAPPKTFVKPAEAATETSATTTSTATTAAPSASATSTSTPASSATVAATATPIRRATPETTAPATATPSATARATATPVETATATPRPPRPIARSASSPSASPSATASPAPSAAASPTSARSPMERSRSRRSPSAPIATPTPRAERARPTAEPSASPSPGLSASQTPDSSVAPTDLSRRERREMKKEERQASKEERRKEKRRGVEPVAGGSNSTPTITPTPAKQ
jgi:Family of unknown function (DUF6600)